MISITYKSNLKSVIRMVDNLRKRFARVGPATKIMAAILERQHREYFEDGGHQSAGGPAWEPTDAWWVDHMVNNTSKPLVWTGHAREALRARYFGNKVFVDLPEYMRKFQFGPFKFKETFPVVYSGGSWQKVWDGGDGTKTKTIHIHQRQVVDVYVRDVEEMMDRLWEEALG